MKALYYEAMRLLLPGCHAQLVVIAAQLAVVEAQQAVVGGLVAVVGAQFLLCALGRCSLK